MVKSRITNSPENANPGDLMQLIICDFKLFLKMKTFYLSKKKIFLKKCYLQNHNIWKAGFFAREKNKNKNI